MVAASEAEKPIFQLLILPGDGVGPEVIAQTMRVLRWFEQRLPVRIGVVEGSVGGASIDQFGVPVTDDVVEVALASDAVLFGAVGGERWDALPIASRPEAGLLRLRREMDLFANIRPAFCFDGMAEMSSLKPELVEGLDLVIVREATAGVYFGVPRGEQVAADGSVRVIDTQSYTAAEVERVCAVAMDLALSRSRRVCVVDKANVMETGALWRRVATEVAARYPSIETSFLYADNCAMQLLRDPRQFDVIVTDNLFGDILSDEAAMLTGSLGLLPSASLGPSVNGRRHALYEPVHGSAPDIAGRDLVNPLATILSLAMAFTFSFDAPAEAALLQEAVAQVLASGKRTRDVARGSDQPVTCQQIGDAVLQHLQSTVATTAKKQGFAFA